LGYYYMFLSAANCCNGPLTGYSVFAGRSVSLTGPYFDRDGNSLLEFDTDDSDPSTGRIGGTPVLTLNGNRWVGPGHNTVFRDYDGQWWTIYHAVLRQAWTKRDAQPWIRGGTWRYDLGAGAKIGLVSMGEPGDQEFTSYIDWVRVYELDIRRPAPPGSF
jgi:beta-xylosidase